VADRPARRLPLLAAALGGALYFLGYLGFGLWPLLAIFLVPLWWSLESAPGLAAAAGRGATFGAVAFVGGHLWLLRLVPVFLDGDWLFGGLLWLAYGAVFAAGFAVYGAAHRALRRRGVGPATAGAAPWLVLEWLQPNLFPVHAGSGWVDVVPLAQAAELGGPLLLSGLVLAANLAVLEATRLALGVRPASRATLAACLAVLAAATVAGHARVSAIEARVARAAPLEVGLVQANLGLLEKRRDADAGHRQHLAQTRELLAEGPLDLVVWPETAYARALRGPLPVAGHLVRRGFDAALLFGGTLAEDDGHGPVQTNAALLVSPDGMIRDAYRKNLLIPLAERLPLADRVPWIAARLPRAQRFRAAERVPGLALGEHRLSVPICYEAIRPEFVRRMVIEARPHLLVTLANDAWFGDSQEPRIHLALARLRAIEHRRFLVRATNSGISALVDPAGRVTARTGVLSRENLRGRVAWLDGETPYARLGGWPGPAAAAWLLAGWAWARRRGCWRAGRGRGGAAGPRRGRGGPPRRGRG
jgi:apolipoprotein N-acyltransferase